MSIFNTSRWYKVNNEVHGSMLDEEPQIYMAEYANISNDQLVLTTDSLTSPIPHPNHDSCYYNNQHYYVSGEIASCIPYQYGYYEIYAKIPAYQGAFPAF